MNRSDAFWLELSVTCGEVSIEKGAPDELPHMFSDRESCVIFRILFLLRKFKTSNLISLVLRFLTNPLGLTLFTSLLVGFIFIQKDVSALRDQVKIPTQILNQISQKGQTDVLFYFQDKAPLQMKSLNELSKEERGQRVYESLVAFSQKSQANLKQNLKDMGLQFQSFYIENAILIRNINQEQLSSLALSTKSLEKIRPNSTVHLKLPNHKDLNLGEDPSKSDLPSPLRLTKVGEAWKEFGTRGKGIVVGGQDTGYFWQHKALINQYRGSQNSELSHDYHWHDAIKNSSGSCSGQSREPCDDQGHGTHTMGSIIGYDGGENQIGSAPEAQWVGCRNMDQGVGKASTYLECFEFFLAPYPFGGDSQTDGRPDLAPHIVNNSWSCPKKEGCLGDEFIHAVGALKAAGIFVVVAAGNEGSSCGTIESPPASYAGEIFSVGAYNRFTRDIAFFSSRGPSGWNQKLAPNLIAPGTLVRSAIHTGANNYTDKAGTSMASPLVAGVVALMWSAFPELVGKIDKTTQLLESSAQPIETRSSCGLRGKIPNHVMGYGMINVVEALRLYKSELQ